MNNIFKITREMAYEMNHPVTLIHGYVDLLTKRMQSEGFPRSPELNAIIDEIKGNCLKANVIAENLQDLANKDCVGKEIWTNSVHIVERVTSLFAERIKKLGVRVKIQHQHPDIDFLSQQFLLVQILACIFDQSIDRLKDSTIKAISFTTLINTDDDPDRSIIIRIHDSGSHKTMLPQVEFSEAILSRFLGKIRLIDASFGACVELRFPIAMKGLVHSRDASVNE